MCTKSKQNNHNTYIEDDEILPLYGDSDYSDYVTDSEVENELFEIEQKKSIKEKQKNKKLNKNKSTSVTNKNEINKEPDDIDISDTYEDILYTDDDQENNNEINKMNNFDVIKLNNSNNHNISNKREGLNNKEIDKIIKECIERYKMEWEEKKLDKFNKRMAHYYKIKDEYQGVENEYNDITFKRIPSLIENIKLHEFKNEKLLIRCCGILQESIYTQCRLHWLLELFKKPIDYVIEQSKLQNNKSKEMDEKYEKKEKNIKNNYSYVYEKEDWSDFIDDSEEIIEDGEIIEDEEFDNNKSNNILENNNTEIKINDNLKFITKDVLSKKNENINENVLPSNNNNNDKIDDIEYQKNNINNNINNKNEDQNANINQNNKQIENNKELVDNNKYKNSSKTSDSLNSEFKKLYNIYNDEILSIAENLKDIDINLLENEGLDNSNISKSELNNKNFELKKESLNENKSIVEDLSINTTNKNNDLITIKDSNNASINTNNKINNKSNLNDGEKVIVVIDSDSDEDEDDNNIKAKESYQSDLRNINKSINEKGLHIPPPNFKIKTYNKEESMFERI